jgi:hypothetical protein
MSTSQEARNHSLQVPVYEHTSFNRHRTWVFSALCHEKSALRAKAAWGGSQPFMPGLTAPAVATGRIFAGHSFALDS